MIPFEDTARPVLVVAIGALHQPLVYAMAKRHIELSSLLQVAGIAKLGLRLDQHVFPGLRMVHRVAGGAANVIDRKSTRLNSSHLVISYAVFCLKKKNKTHPVISHTLSSTMLHHMLTH